MQKTQQRPKKPKNRSKKHYYKGSNDGHKPSNSDMNRIFDAYNSKKEEYSKSTLIELLELKSKALLKGRYLDALNDVISQKQALKAKQDDTTISNTSRGMV